MVEDDLGYLLSGGSWSPEASGGHASLNLIREYSFRLQCAQAKDATMALATVAKSSKLVKTRQRMSIIKADPPDNRVLECDLASGPRRVVNRDRHLLSLKEFRGIKVMKPKEFLARFGSTPHSPGQDLAHHVEESGKTGIWIGSPRECGLSEHERKIVNVACQARESLPSTLSTDRGRHVQIPPPALVGLVV
jgi:hypothetical protein